MTELKGNKNMSKAVAILVNDVHLDKDNVELVRDIFRQLAILCAERNVGDIIIGGDVFTNRSGQPLTCLTTWKAVLKELAKLGITVHIIAGNHDKTDADDENSYLSIYSGQKLYKHATVVDINGVSFTMIPYFSESKWMEEWKSVSDEETNAVSILVTHIGFDGVVNNDGSLVESNLKVSMFRDYTKVLVGHYHNASKLGSNIYYTGSAYQNNYGESVEDKGFTVIYNDGKIESVASKFPKYIKEVVNANDRECLRNLLEKYEGEKYDHVRFQIVGTKVDCEKINVADIQNRGIDCKFVSDEESKAVEISESDGGVACFDKKQIIRDFMAYCKENNITGEKMKFGMKLINNI